MFFLSRLAWYIPPLSSRDVVSSLNQGADKVKSLGLFILPISFTAGGLFGWKGGVACFAFLSTVPIWVKEASKRFPSPIPLLEEREEELVEVDEEVSQFSEGEIPEEVEEKKTGEIPPIIVSSSEKDLPSISKIFSLVSYLRGNVSQQTKGRSSTSLLSAFTQNTFNTQAAQTMVTYATSASGLKRAITEGPQYCHRVQLPPQIGLIRPPLSEGNSPWREVTQVWEEAYSVPQNPKSTIQKNVNALLSKALDRAAQNSNSRDPKERWHLLLRAMEVGARIERKKTESERDHLGIYPPYALEPIKGDSNPIDQSREGSVRPAWETSKQIDLKIRQQGGVVARWPDVDEILRSIEDGTFETKGEAPLYLRTTLLVQLAAMRSLFSSPDCSAVHGTATLVFGADGSFVKPRAVPVLLCKDHPSLFSSVEQWRRWNHLERFFFVEGCFSILSQERRKDLLTLFKRFGWLCTLGDFASVRFSIEKDHQKLPETSFFVTNHNQIQDIPGRQDLKEIGRKYQAWKEQKSTSIATLEGMMILPTQETTAEHWLPIAIQRAWEQKRSKIIVLGTETSLARIRLVAEKLCAFLDTEVIGYVLESGPRT